MSYLADWKPEQLAQWERDDEEAVAPVKAKLEAYTTFYEDIKRLENEVARYAYAHETMPRPERAPHDLKVSDMKTAIKEAYRMLRANWPEQPELQLSRVQREWEAQHATERAPLLAQIEALKEADHDLRDLKQQDDDKAIDQQLAEDKLTRIKEQRARIAAWVEQVRGIFAEHAAALSFDGQPTVDLPARASGLHRAMRYEPSLIVGINATEKDVTRREEFERAAAQ